MLGFRKISNSISDFIYAYRWPVLIFIVSRIIVFGTYFFTRWYGFGDVNFHQWDANSYLNIAQQGYHFNGSYLNEGSYIAFFPLSSILIRLFHIVTSLDYYQAGLLMTFTCGIFAACLLYRLVRDWKGEAAATTAVMLFSFFPTSFFLTATYSESLFIVLALTSFLYLKTSRYLPAVLFASLSLVTRMTGILFLPIFFIELIRARKKLSLVVFLLLLILLIAPFAIFLLYQYQNYGTPLAFMEAQKINWHHQAVWPWVGFGNLWRSAVDGSFLGSMWRVDFFFLSLMMVTLVLASRRLPWTWLFFGWGVVLLTISQSFILGTSRYMLLVLPFYVYWGEILSRRELLKQAILGIMASWLAFNTLLFILSKNIF